MSERFQYFLQDMTRDTVDVVMPSSSATSRIDPQRDSSRRMRSRRTSMTTSFTIREQYVQHIHVDADDPHPIY